MSADEELLKHAREAMRHAYAPYSGLRVGAAVRGESGQVYAGCNVENAAYPNGVCAEASALSAMIAGGDKRIVAALVIGESDTPCPPCGACRQRLAEFAASSVPVHLCGIGTTRKTVTVGELLPHPFSPSQLP